MPLAPVNGIDLFYECIDPAAGESPVLLLIHGLGSSGDDWAFQRDDFSRQHRLILPDLRGSGRSSKPDGRYSIRAFADDLWALLDTLGVATTAILGFSMGGAVAIEMALVQPSRVSKLIVCNALANYRTDTPRKWFEAKLQIALVHLLGLKRTARFIARRLFPHDDQEPKRQRVIDVLAANPKRAYLQTIRALIGWSALDRLPALTCNTLIIAADNDYTPLAEKRNEAALFPCAEFVVVADSRHGTPFDAIERFNALVLGFLAR